jgi:hypothetical protein
MTVVYYSENIFPGTKILYAVVDQANVEKKHSLLFDKVKDITCSLTARLSLSTKNGVFKYYKKIDDAMVDSDNFDIVFIQSVGNFIKNNEIITHFENYYKLNPDFFMLSFTLDWDSERGEGWVECHHQMMVVNTHKWKQLGSPKFGKWETVTEMLPNYIRSEENFHDKYTPYWIQGATGHTEKVRSRGGWGFIKAALENGVKVDNFTQDMRDCRLYVYPETDSEKLWSAFTAKDPLLVTNPNQQKWVSNLLPVPTIWVYNSEHYRFNIKFDHCDTYVGPAAGFKYLDILSNRDNINYVFYDFHQKSLDWIKHLKETWDGNDFSEFLKNQNIDYTSCFKYINNSILSNQQKLFADFGSEDEFKKLWAKFKSCKAEFMLCDLYEPDDVESLISKIPDGSTPFVYYSNIFSTDFTLIYRTSTYVENYRKELVNYVTDQYPTAITHGTNVNGTWCTTKTNKSNFVTRLLNAVL